MDAMYFAYILLSHGDKVISETLKTFTRHSIRLIEDSTVLHDELCKQRCKQNGLILSELAKWQVIENDIRD